MIYDTCLDTNRWLLNIKRRISVIDDNLKFFQSVKKYIQNDNTDVNYVMSVKETLNILLSGEYCLVIISIQSFANHNTEIIRLIRETSPFSIMLIVPKPSIEEKVRSEEHTSELQSH